MVRKAAKSKPKISPQRAQDWISSVMNPIILGIRRELWLASKPLRWLHETRDFEYLHPIRDYVADIYVDNYEDFIEKHPELEPAFRRHDEVLDGLRTAVTVGFDTLANDTAFQTTLASGTANSNFREIDYRYFMAHIAGGYLELQHPYSHHDVYNALPSSVRDPERLHQVKQLRMAGLRKLSELDQETHDRLVKLRTEIADRYGARIQPVE